MAIKWIKTAHKGLRYYEHQNRRHGKKRDRYYAIRFKVANKDYSYGVGWWSEGIPDETKKEDPQLGFEEYALKLLRQYQGNIKAGTGPQSPKQKRSEEEKRRKAQKVLNDELEKDKITFKQYFDDTYLPTFEIGRKKDSTRKGKEHFKNWIEPVIGNTPLRDIKPFAIEKIKKNILGAGKSPRTLQYIFATIRQAWNMARRDGLVMGDSPTKSVKIPKVDNRRVRFLSHDEAETLLKALQTRDPRTHDLALLSLHTGLRMGEMASLKWGHIDLDRGIIRVMDPKGVEGRVAFMTEKVKAMLGAIKRREPDDHVFTKAKEEKLKETPKMFAEVVADQGLNNGITDRRQRVYFHTCRHTFASWHVSAGTDLYTVKELMGHSVIAMTERYSHLGKNTLLNATKSFEQAIDHTDEVEAEQQVENIAK